MSGKRHWTIPTIVAMLILSHLRASAVSLMMGQAVPAMLEDDAAHVRCCIDQVTSLQRRTVVDTTCDGGAWLFASTFDEFAFIRGILKMQMTEQSPVSEHGAFRHGLHRDEYGEGIGRHRHR